VWFGFEVECGRGKDEALVIHDDKCGSQSWRIAHDDANFTQTFHRLSVAVAHAHDTLIKVNAHGHHFGAKSLSRLGYGLCRLKLGFALKGRVASENWRVPQKSKGKAP
jgi:hypothetical protein